MPQTTRPPAASNGSSLADSTRHSASAQVVRKREYVIELVGRDRSLEPRPERRVRSRRDLARAQARAVADRAPRPRSAPPRRSPRRPRPARPRQPRRRGQDCLVDACLRPDRAVAQHDRAADRRPLADLGPAADHGPGADRRARPHRDPGLEQCRRIDARARVHLRSVRDQQPGAVEARGGARSARGPRGCPSLPAGSARECRCPSSSPPACDRTTPGPTRRGKTSRSIETISPGGIRSITLRSST